MASFLPTTLPKDEKVQLFIFLFLFLISGVALSTSWLGVSYLISNMMLMILSIFCNVHTQNAKLFYMYAYSFLISALIDPFIIGFGWDRNYAYYSGFQFFLGFILAVLVIIAKIFLFLYELQIAKKLAGEEPLPYNIEAIISPPGNASQTSANTISNQPPPYNTRPQQADDQKSNYRQAQEGSVDNL